MASRKVALVTGAATGIGASAVLALARAGYDIAVNYSSSEKAARETAAQAEKLGPKTLVIKCDVADEAGVGGLLPCIKKKVRRPGELLHQARTAPASNPQNISTLSPDEWRRPIPPH